ncbi:hypothetical protein OXX79_007740 [Metschnikowia pulcherrima]
MAFPLEPTQLRAQQRAFYLATCENDHDSTRRIIKPLTSGLYYESCNEKYFCDYRPSSPPIPIDLPETTSRGTLTTPVVQNKRQSSRANTRAAHTRRKSKMSTTSKIKESPAENIPQAELLDFRRPSVSAESLESLKTTKKQTSKINPLSRLFVKSDKSKIQRSDSESTISRSSLSIPAESIMASTISAQTVDRFEDFSDSEPSVNEILTDENYISEDIETLDHHDTSNMGTDDDDSLISAFTDIEADSMIEGSSNLMYDYTVPKTSVLRSDAETKQRQKLKNEQLAHSKKPSSVNGISQKSKGDLDVETSGKHTPSLRPRESFTFSKILDCLPKKKGGLTSNLSQIIQTRHTSSNANPLTYFSYNEANCAEGSRKAEVSIFVPPSTAPVLEKLSITGNMSVFDCIGYVLLKICETNGERQLSDTGFSKNPNHWRLELTDEDGELYDSNFGILDRTRLMASYNCPKYLALCKANDTQEITSNEKQSPLPLEFKQNLDLHEERARHGKETERKGMLATENWEHAATGGNSIEVKVKNIPSTSKVISFFVASEMLVGDLLDLICRQYQVDPAKFRLSGFLKSLGTNTSNASLLTDSRRHEEGRTLALQNTDKLADTHVDFFKLDPIIKIPVRSMLDVKSRRGSFKEAGITPNSSAFIQAGITPPVTQVETNDDQSASNTRIEEAMNETHTPQAMKQTPSAAMKASHGLNANLIIDNLISGKSNQLPTSLSTFYCKWRVFRKKAPLIYRIEKSLIIDGDYIHLAPTDDTNWKSTFHDNSFSGASQSGNHHHHHYLHHYNYSKYYNDTMLKTSSFHISQIVKLKSYKESKSPTHFKIVIKKEGESGGKETVIKKKYDLEAETVAQCDEIFEKIRWALQLYNASSVNL